MVVFHNVVVVCILLWEDPMIGVYFSDLIYPVPSYSNLAKDTSLGMFLPCSIIRNPWIDHSYKSSIWRRDDFDNYSTPSEDGMIDALDNSMSMHFSPMFYPLRKINIGFFFKFNVFSEVLFSNLIQLHFLLPFVSSLHTLKLLSFFYLLLYKEEMKLDYRFFPENHRIEVYLVYNFTFFLLSFHRIPAIIVPIDLRFRYPQFMFKIRNTIAIFTIFQINSLNQFVSSIHFFFKDR